MSKPVAVVLAAGKSSRMKSETPKVLHEIFGRKMIDYVLDAVRAVGTEKIVVIVGHKADIVKAHLSQYDDVEFAVQAEQNGTGHAVMMCEENLASHEGPVMILAGDTPLLTGPSLQALLDEQASMTAACVIGTAETEANQGLGRVVRGADGSFSRIVEEKDASAEERAITEINTGCYVFDCQHMLRALKQLKPENVQAEYYLTDCPAILLSEGETVAASCSLDIQEAMGVNTRVQLGMVTEVIQSEAMERLMVSGVTIVNPAQTHVDPRAKVGRDSVIHPFTVIGGSAEIGEGCTIGPHSHVNGSVASGTTLDAYSNVG